ncbi:outer membrane beta-barrel family protein [Brevundimonas lenta]|uniref:Outer membrane receptor protein involved in Fe transport n=1 Tax=Brevundimonas lenta TaxID=424796 RepID=A0A7W6JAW2_9CAUL|nr:outer membrane beta-barrel family protein [Brevundimonas lenta]MBB4081712.1 outer membrane receptor protein involved in Fe transport [Brevundimonas lenta]
MPNLKLILLAGVALTLPAGAAAAQTQPAPTQPPAQPARPAGTEEAPAALEEVVVQSRATDIRTSIDSTSYSLKDDLQAQTGTLADALRNVPSVDVDPQGNVSLRGDGNVTILVDGRPSGVFSGESRAQAVLSLPADQYSRIEVMTNPSAAYSPEGSGGVINLISKPNAAKAGAVSTGSVRANVGGGGRWNLGLNGSTTRGDLTLSGDVGTRHDLARQTFDRVREQLNPVTGDLISTTHQTQDVDGDSDVHFGRLNAEYRLTEQVQLTGEIRGNLIDTGGRGLEVYDTTDAAGAPVSLYTRDGGFGFEGDNLGATARILRRFGGEQGHDWTTELRVDRNRGHFSMDSAYDYDLPVAPAAFETIDNRNRLILTGFSSAYVRPMPDAGKLRTGYELEIRDSAFDNAASRGPSPDALVPDPFVTNRFEVFQQVHAGYITYERPWGDLSAQFGLRLEYADVEMNQVTTDILTSQHYFRAYPTLHVSYQLTEAELVRGSYSRRIQRPVPFLLNPFTSYQDPLNLRSGNPDLEPQETDAFELMWQKRAGQTFYQATAYYRDTQKAFTEVATDIGGGVLLTRPENLGSRRDYGVEVVANGKLHETLRYNASLNLFRQEIDAAGIPGGQDRSGTVITGRATLNWQPTPEDFVQLSGLYQGDQLLAQGEREAGGMLNLGYRRKLSETLAFQLTVRDLLDDFGDVTTYDTPTFTDRTERTFGGRAWYVGLTYSFGGGPRRQQDPQFDFSAPQTGG